MSDQKLIPEKLPDCIEETAKALLQPVGETTGGTISNIMKLVFWPLTTASRLASGQQDYLIEMQKVKHAQQLEVYAKEIKEKLEKIPEEKRIEPDTRIVWDAFEKSRSALGVEEIRHLYANLIANAANSDIAHQIHPSFSTIISQLSPLDVQNLEILSDGDLYPIANYVSFSNEPSINGKTEYKTIHPDVFLSNPNNQDFFIQAVSINTLTRLQLITVDYTKQISVSEAYASIQEYFDENIINNCQEGWSAKIIKGIVHTTHLGRAFLAVCHSPFGQISETSVEQ